jgi:hypothetical protein
VFAYGISIDEFTRIKNYGAAPWTPGPTMTINPPTAPPRQDPPANDRVARNLEIAKTFFDAYHHAVERGGLTDLFSSEMFADDWVLFSPWFGETAQSKGSDVAALAEAQLKRTWTRLPDYKMDHFEAWPTEDGCAWRWCVNGHAADGTRYEVWEQLFTQTDSQGKITRLEIFDDWQGFPQMLGFITGLTLDRLWDAGNYRAWIVGAD